MFNWLRTFRPEDLEACRSILSGIADLFEEGGEKEFAALLRTHLSGTSKDLERFLRSGSLWSGMGSIPDCAFVGNPGFGGWDTNKSNRKEYERLMNKLGRRLILAGKATRATKRFVNDFSGSQ
jgi:hypothetical protein